MNENCPYCGEQPVQIGATLNVACCTKECSIAGKVFTVAAWNKRFVCPDKNGDKVYAGDEVRTTASDSPDGFVGKAQLLVCVPVDGVPMPLEYLRCEADGKGLTLEIELIQAADNEQ